MVTSAFAETPALTNDTVKQFAEMHVFADGWTRRTSALNTCVLSIPMAILAFFTFEALGDTPCFEYAAPYTIFVGVKYVLTTLAVGFITMELNKSLVSTINSLVKKLVSPWALRTCYFFSFVAELVMFVFSTTVLIKISRDEACARETPVQWVLMLVLTTAGSITTTLSFFTSWYNASKRRHEVDLIDARTSIIFMHTYATENEDDNL
jgi:hypothetical protein